LICNFPDFELSKYFRYSLEIRWFELSLDCPVLLVFIFAFFGLLAQPARAFAAAKGIITTPA
jgi:hypothetical protein